MSLALLALYAALLGLCAVHGGHRLVLFFAWLRHRRNVPGRGGLPDVLPFVTVQLPVYNERDVVARLVDAAAALDWPRDRFELQLLDDSTDDTPLVAAPAVARARAAGVSVQVLRRTQRTGFKAGALAEGLRLARGELLAVFDADFVPGADFLRQTVAAFTDPGVGMVQARWAHLNAESSPLTVAQAALLDGHFVIEHTARNRSGRWFNFNGTAGVWRRRCVEDAGGWQHDTLTEDLDLSYRAQLRGWRFVYLVDHVVPAEVPATLAAFRVQQRRWAKGSIEVARKLSRRIAAAPAPWATRAEALAHLWANLTWPAALALACVLPLLVLSGQRASAWVYVPAFLLSTAAHLLFYGVATGGRLRAVVLATLLGIGMAANQTAAVVEALRGQRSGFVRTPKSGDGRGSYRVVEHATVPLELVIAAANLGVAAWAIAGGAWAAVPFLLLFGAGFAWTGLGGLREAAAGRREAELAPRIRAFAGGE